MHTFFVLILFKGADQAARMHGLSLSLYLHWQQFGPRLDPNIIQERMFLICRFWHVIESLQSVNTVECPTPMRTIIHTIGPHRKQL